VRIRRLVEYFGSAAAALQAKTEYWLDVPGFNTKNIPADSFFEGAESERNFEMIKRFGVRVISYQCSEYPQHLLKIPDFPLVLYVKGRILPEDNRSIAVVGTRNATIYGMETAEKMAAGLSGAGLTVVSGLARGIDTAAHKAAVKKGRTIAVIGSGLADIYPRENNRLAEEISEKGAVISEFPMLTPPDRQNFPQRNRIVSGMTLGTLLIEAPLKSGAMLTMENAFDHERELFAIPGRTDSENYRGNLSLLKSGKARLVENSSDIIKFFGIAERKENFLFEKESAIDLNPEEKKFISLLPQEEVSLHRIEELVQLPITKIHVLLMSLLLKNAIREYPGKIYKKLV